MTGFRIQVVFRMKFEDSGFRIQVTSSFFTTGFRIQVGGFRIQDSGSACHNSNWVETVARHYNW